MNVRKIIPPTRGLGWAVFGVSAVLYILTSCRTVYVGDSGELSLVLATGGIAHPPGYPLYTVIGYVWLKLLFFLRPAYAANLFSAFVAAAGAGLLYRLLERIGRPHLPPVVAAAGALLYAFARPVWFSAVQAEVYALSGLLFIAALYAIVLLYYEGGTRHLIVSATLCGLVLTHHFSAGVVIASLVIVIAIRFRTDRMARSMAVAVAAFLLPLTLYLYLLQRFDPSLPINWLTDRTLPALWSVVSGENYRQFVDIASPADLIHLARDLALKSFMYFGPGLVLLAVPGLIFMIRRDFKLATVLIAPAALNLCCVTCYHIPDYEGYLAPLLVSAAMFITSGIAWLYTARKISPAATAAIACILIGVPAVTNYAECDLHDFRLAERYGADVLDSAVPGSVVILKSDNASHAGLYLRYAEGYRSDIEVYSSHCTMTRMAHRYRLDRSAPVLDSVLHREGNIYWGIEYVVNQGMNPSPGEKKMRGMLYGPPDAPDDPELERRLDRFALDTLPLVDLNGNNKARHIYLAYRLRYIDRLLMAGQHSPAADLTDDLFRWGRALDQPRACLAVAQFYLARDLIDESLIWVDLARQADPMTHEEKDIYVNLGTIYRRAGSLDMAYKSLVRALDIDDDYEPARYNFALVEAELAVRQQDWTAALDAFSLLTKLEPDNPLPYFNLAVIYDRLPGREEQAADNYSRFISMAENNHPQAVRKARERLTELDSAMADSR